jgi:cytoskeletal protein CcmA (bactofilin family)
MSTQARVSNDERGKPRLINGQHGSVNKDNWLGFVGDVVDFTGEVSFRSMLRIDGRFSGNVTSTHRRGSDEGGN